MPAPTSQIDPHPLADRFTRAIADADMATMRELYTPDAVIWHCTDGIELSVDDLDGLLTAIGRVSTCSVEVRSRQTTATGFVQAQVNTYALKEGGEVVLRCALLVASDGTHISRVDEYLDGVALAPLIDALQA